MARIMAVDYGTKRTGLAVTDPGQLIATGLDTVRSADVMEYLKNYLSREAVELIVVGDPRQMDGTDSMVAPQINRFVEQLKKNFPHIPVRRVDERFTSKMAQATLLMSGLKKKDRQDKSLVDLTSAIIILQSFMESLKK